MSRIAIASRLAGFWIVCLAAAGVWSAAQTESESGLGHDDPAVVALAASVEVERTLLDEDRERYRQLALRRSTTETRLGELREALDEAVATEDASSLQRLERLAEEIRQVEGERDQRIEAANVLIERLGERLRRIALLEERLSELRGRRDEQAGALSGTWDFVLLPIDTRGACLLRQTGTLVTGTYRLSGGLNGSLQGTLVNRKVYLVRIDSKLGRSMEFEGHLSSDGRKILGTWLNYELAGGDGSTGQWSATKRQSAP